MSSTAVGGARAKDREVDADDHPHESGARGQLAQRGWWLRHSNLPHAWWDAGG
jgi:hypothetical protein